jgi:SM-20-related protein
MPGTEQYLAQYEHIADGLATDGYAIVGKFLTMQEVNHILNLDEFKAGLFHFRKAGIGKQSDKQINEAIRGDYIHWIDKNTAAAPLKHYLDRLQEMILYINRTLFLSIRDTEVHMTIYPRGAYYKRHLDQFRADDHRKLSVICYLNKDWTNYDGGQLRMHLPSGHLDVLPDAGKLVCFRSDMIEHEVLPANRERLSLTGWLLNQEKF